MRTFYTHIYFILNYLASINYCQKQNLPKLVHKIFPRIMFRMLLAYKNLIFFGKENMASFVWYALKYHQKFLSKLTENTCL